MVNDMLKNIAIASLFYCLLYSNAFCYDDEITHHSLTEESIKKSQLKQYLVNNLKFENGIETKIPSSSTDDVVDLLTRGSNEEDHPNCRAASHFLDPLKPWKDAGVSDTNETILGFIADPVCFIGAPFSDRYSIHKYADVTWAGFTAPSSALIDTGNDMDWNAARNYYQLALTALDKSTREGNFAKSFQVLGQVMHLLQDMAVPAHVWNDFSAQCLREGLS